MRGQQAEFLSSSRLQVSSIRSHRNRTVYAPSKNATDVLVRQQQFDAERKRPVLIKWIATLYSTTFSHPDNSSFVHLEQILTIMLLFSGNAKRPRFTSHAETGTEILYLYTRQRFGGHETVFCLYPPKIPT